MNQILDEEYGQLYRIGNDSREDMYQKSSQGNTMMTQDQKSSLNTYTF